MSIERVALAAIAIAAVAYSVSQFSKPSAAAADATPKHILGGSAVLAK
jgi:hypothetical protein